MIYGVLLLLLLALAGWFWLSRRRERQRVIRHARRHERRLQDQRVWEAAIAARARGEVAPAD